VNGGLQIHAKPGGLLSPGINALNEVVKQSIVFVLLDYQ